MLRLVLLFSALSALFLPSKSRAVEPEAKTEAEVLPLNTLRNLRAGKAQSVVVYGTSLTVGGAWAVALRDYFDKNFPRQVKFSNGGGSGQNSDWGVQNLQKKVLDQKPDLVFIEFSYNDAHQKFNLTPEKALANLDTMVKALQGQNPQIDIVLQTMNLPWDAPNGNGSKTVRPQIEIFNDNYRRYAREHHLVLLDHYQNWLALWQNDEAKYQKWLPDGSHPIKEASLTITWPTIEALLEKARAASAN